MKVTEEDLDTAIEEMKASAVPSRHCVLTVAAKRQFPKVLFTSGSVICSKSKIIAEFEDCVLAYKVQDLFDNKKYAKVREMLPLELETNENNNY